MYDVAKYGGQLTEFMKEKNIKPFSNMFPIMVQLPIFVSMFVGLRGLANLPLESMMHGGLFWFEDLTIADPFYLLPLMTSTSMFLQFKYAAEGASLETAGPIAKVVFKVLPFILLPVTINFPAVSWPLTIRAPSCIFRVVLNNASCLSALDKQSELLYKVQSFFRCTWVVATWAQLVVSCALAQCSYG